MIAITQTFTVYDNKNIIDIVFVFLKHVIKSLIDALQLVHGNMTGRSRIDIR
jgi:hypothetical protein